MKNKKITRKISQGMYVLTTKNGGCIVDAVSQISIGDNPLIAVAVMKSNYTNELLFPLNSSIWFWRNVITNSVHSLYLFEYSVSYFE